MSGDGRLPDATHAARLLAALLPGVALTMVHMAMLDIVTDDVIQAVDSDRYRFLWAVGTYLLGGGTGMAMTKWWAGRFGLRGSYVLGLIFFSVAGALCGGTSQIATLAPLRLVQGYGMGLVVAAAMLILWRSFPRHKEWAMGMYAIGVYSSSLLGPTTGAFLVSVANWRWIFLGNLPVGLLLAWLGWRLLPADRPTGNPAPFDSIGLLLLAAWIATLNVVLDMGQYWGWTRSPTFVSWLAAFVVSFSLFIAWGLLHRHPLISLWPFRNRVFTVGLVVKMIYSINLYVVLSLLSAYMSKLRGYQWWEGGLVILPASLFMVAAILLGLLWGSNADRKARIVVGLLAMAAITWRLSYVDLYTSKMVLAALLMPWGIGAGLVVAPIIVTIFENVSLEEAANGAGIFNILRAIPAFVYGAIAVTLLTQNADWYFDLYRRDVSHNRPIVTATTKRLEDHFRGRGVSRGEGKKLAHATLGRWVHANAKADAFENAFQTLALVTLLGPVFVLLLPRPPAGRSMPLWLPLGTVTS
jgi:DHA2 family multidrug resistance protein